MGSILVSSLLLLLLVLPAVSARANGAGAGASGKRMKGFFNRVGQFMQRVHELNEVANMTILASSPAKAEMLKQLQADMANVTTDGAAAAAAAAAAGSTPTPFGASFLRLVEQIRKYTILITKGTVLMDAGKMAGGTTTEEALLENRRKVVQAAKAVGDAASAIIDADDDGATPASGRFHRLMVAIDRLMELHRQEYGMMDGASMENGEARGAESMKKSLKDVSEASHDVAATAVAADSQ